MKEPDCKQCYSKIPAKGTSLISAVLVMILPKCPFCVMAYSSAITMCGTATLHTVENNWVSYVPIVLALFVVAMIALNYRGVRTFYALSFAFIGFVLILLTHQLVLTSGWYQVGTAILFFSIFLNGPLLFLFNKITKHTYMKSLTTKLSSL